MPAEGPRTVGDGPSSVNLLLDAPITFSVPGRLVHSPMVHATVNGVMTQLILDTGASDHVLTIDLANAAGLGAVPAEPGTDHAGGSVLSWSLGEVPVEVGDLSLTLTSVVAIQGPAPFEGWGIGGFLSPQNMHGSASLVLDLLNDRLILLEGGASDIRAYISAYISANYDALSTVALERVHDSTVQVHASIDPFNAVAMILNTGTDVTEVAAEAVPGLRGIAPSSSGFGVGGTEVDGEEVANQVLRIGDSTIRLHNLLVRPNMPAPPGQVGMDVLRGTVLVVHPDPSEPVEWLVPGAGS